MATQYISDIISNDEIQSWNTGDVITIKAGTGMGKSHFIKNDLYEYAKSNNKKILMLIHRKNTVDQFREELEREGKFKSVIQVHTYQTLENIPDFTLDEYNYLVVDEFQYFLSDSSFNNKTEISLNRILKQDNKVRILMSATGERMIEYLKENRNLKFIEYEMATNFDKIKKLQFFNKESIMEDFIQRAIKNNVKAVFFINDTEKAYQLHKKYKKHTLFNCSEGQTKYYKYVDKNKIQNMLEKEKFEDLILITTTVMDTGLNLEDEKLHNIVISNVADVDQVIQCIGRKRIKDEDDYISLFIHSIHNQQLGRRKGQLVKRLKQPKELINGTVEDFTNKYNRSRSVSDIIYDEIVEGETDKVTKKVNNLMYYKCTTDIEDIDKMIRLGGYGYNKYISDILGFEYKSPIDVNQEKVTLSDYLDGIVGKKLYKEDQQQLKEVFKKNGLSARTLGINTLNGNLKDRKLNYIIKSGERSSYRDGNGKVKKDKSHWIIGKITY